MSEEHARSLLIQKYSAHLRCHGHLIIGLALITLGLLQIRPYMEEPWGMPVPLLLGLSVHKGYVFYFCIFLTTSVFWFVLMRHFVYGNLLDAASAPIEPNQPQPTELNQILKQMLKEIDKRITERHVLGLETRLFYGHWSTRRTIGLLICLALGFITSLCLYVLME